LILSQKSPAILCGGGTNKKEEDQMNPLQEGYAASSQGIKITFKLISNVLYML